MLKTYGYLRVSGRGQVAGDGFPRQRDAIQRYAAAHDMVVVRWFEERAVSGAREWESRPAWSDMVQNLNGVRTIIVERVDRLARDLGVQEWIMRDLKQRGVVLLSATEENLDEDPSRVLFRQMLGAIAQYDRAMTVLKLRSARQRVKAAVGRCEGAKPFGSLLGEAATLTRMVELSATLCPLAIARTLNEEGLKTRLGCPWHSGVIARILARRG